MSISRNLYPAVGMMLAVLLASCKIVPEPDVGLRPLKLDGYEMFATPRTLYEPGTVILLPADGGVEVVVATLDVPTKNGTMGLADYRGDGEWSAEALASFLGDADVGAAVGSSATVRCTVSPKGAQQHVAGVSDIVRALRANPPEKVSGQLVVIAETVSVSGLGYRFEDAVHSRLKASLNISPETPGATNAAVGGVWSESETRELVQNFGKPHHLFYKGWGIDGLNLDQPSSGKSEEVGRRLPAVHKTLALERGEKTWLGSPRAIADELLSCTGNDIVSVSINLIGNTYSEAWAYMYVTLAGVTTGGEEFAVEPEHMQGGQLRAYAALPGPRSGDSKAWAWAVTPTFEFVIPSRGEYRLKIVIEGEGATVQVVNGLLDVTIE